MHNRISITVNGRPFEVAPESTVAAAVAAAGVSFRKSVTGEARGSLCGMGVCYECRITINGQPHCRSCQIVCQTGMAVRTDE